jgi:hypothetical protein
MKEIWLIKYQKFDYVKKNANTKFNLDSYLSEELTKKFKIKLINITIKIKSFIFLIKKVEYSFIYRKNTLYFVILSKVCFIHTII